jgi:hypothetical protein
MKKNALISLFLLLISTSLYAQDVFFNDSLRMHLKNYLVDRKAGWNLDSYHPGMLNILNEINNKNIDTHPEVREYKYGIYSFWGDQLPAFYEILIRRGDKYEILGMLNDRSMMETMTKLMAYFYRNPDVPKELFPLYVDAVYRVYNLNFHWEGAYNVKKKRNIEEYGQYSERDTQYRIIEDSEGDIHISID